MYFDPVLELFLDRCSIDRKEEDESCGLFDEIFSMCDIVSCDECPLDQCDFCEVVDDV